MLITRLSGRSVRLPSVGLRSSLLARPGVMVEEGQQSLEARGSPVPEDEQVPFPLLQGECVERVGRAEESVIALTSYRLHIKLQENLINVPLQLIESVECRDLTQLHLTCKDCKLIRCNFLSAEQCQDWLRRISAVVRPPAQLEELFAFAFLSCSASVSAEDREVHDGICRAGTGPCNFLSAEQCQDWLRRISAVVRPPAQLEELFAFAFLSCSASVSAEDREVHDGICRAVSFCSLVSWLSALEGTKWLQHLSLLLKASLLVVNAVHRDRRPVLVHCSDGWDRTPQIVALSKLMLDPFYRTIEGFQVLVEAEWLDYGHKFADRCGHGENACDLNERCPVFLQWLDCVHQLQRQFPCSFEFNEAFLVKLVQHTYSCLFGTFLCNSVKEREEQRVQEKTCSVWSLLRPANTSFHNILYSLRSEKVLHPVCHVRNLMLWIAVYLPNSAPSTPSDESCVPHSAPSASPEDTPVSR
ncbi:myotubularin-related protein 3-like [Sinocyclocheilus grahami]|uniref:myotubularin-related protein 3-like n=1 Tax=Sinocyclocheilus grahami TaxID=75366 RepID=UPI0007AD51E6|nr:PREDICTED: myotubularin-related protein 3-like [Sinocyclocheilus grahami]